MTTERRAADRRRRGKWQNAFTAAAGVGGILFAAVLTAVWAEKPWLSWAVVPFPVLQPSYRVGEPIYARVTRCNSSDRTQLYSRASQLIREDVPQLPIELGSGQKLVDPGCHQDDDPFKAASMSTLPGRYHLRGVAQVDGRIRNFRLEWISESFDIKEAVP